MRWRSRVDSVVLLVLFAGMLLVILRLSLLRAFNQDEFEAIHSGWKVYAGQRPYADFFQHHHPYLYYVLAGVIAAFGEGLAAVRASRALHFIAALGLFGTTAALARDLFGKRVTLYASALLATSVIFVEKVIEVRPDVLQSLFGLLGVLFFFRHGTSGRRRHVVLSSVCLGISFLFLQKTLFLVAALALLALARWAAGRLRGADLALGALVFVATLLPEYAWMASEGSLATYWALNWTLNVPATGAFDPVFGMIESYKENSLLWIAWLVGLPLCLRDRKQREVALLSAALVGSLFLVKRPWPQYYMVPMPLMALVAAHALETVFVGRRALTAAVIVLGSVPALYHFGFKELYTNERQLRAVEWALATTPPNERIHDGRCSVNLFREDLDWFWFSVRENQLIDRYRELVGEYPYDPVALVRRLRPRIVVDSTLDLDDPRIAGGYVRSEGFKDLWVRVDP